MNEREGERESNEERILEGVYAMKSKEWRKLNLIDLLIANRDGSFSIPSKIGSETQYHRNFSAYISYTAPLE